MKKKVLCLALALLLVLSVAACSTKGEKEPTVPPESSTPTELSTQATEPPETTEPETTEPETEPTLPPEGELPCEQPWCDEVEFICSHDREYKYVEEQVSIVKGQSVGGQWFLYTGESNVVDIPGLDFTLTIPEEWMDRVEVILHRSGWADDGAESVNGVRLLNKELGRSYALAKGDPTDLDEDGTANIYFRQLDPILSVRIYGEEELASDADAQRKLDGGYLLDGGSRNGRHYVLTSTQLGEPEDDPPSLARLELVAAIGQEAYDELVGDLFCTPEQAFEIFQLR